MCRKEWLVSQFCRQREQTPPMTPIVNERLNNEPKSVGYLTCNNIIPHSFFARLCFHRLEVGRKLLTLVAGVRFPLEVLKRAAVKGLST